LRLSTALRNVRSLPLSVQVDANPPEQRIDGAFRLAEHRPDPPPIGLSPSCPPW
jgi:hypothetical protein